MLKIIYLYHELNNMSMNHNQIDRSLRSIGKECFIKYFHEFKNPRYSDDDLVSLLMKKEDYTESGCKIRVTNARRIIKENGIKEALNLVIDSAKLDYTTIMMAKKLLSKY